MLLEQRESGEGPLNGSFETFACCSRGKCREPTGSSSTVPVPERHVPGLHSSGVQEPPKKHGVVIKASIPKDHGLKRETQLGVTSPWVLKSRAQSPAHFIARRKTEVQCPHPHSFILVFVFPSETSANDKGSNSQREGFPPLRPLCAQRGLESGRDQAQPQADSPCRESSEGWGSEGEPDLSRDSGQGF